MSKEIPELPEPYKTIGMVAAADQQGRIRGIEAAYLAMNDNITAQTRAGIKLFMSMMYYDPKNRQYVIDVTTLAQNAFLWNLMLEVERES